MRRTISSHRGMAAAVALFAWTLPASAQGPGWHLNATIARMADITTGGINIRLSPDVSGCTSPMGYGPQYAYVTPDHVAINRIKATLLTAYATGTPISVYLADNTCKIGEVLLGGAP